MTDTTIPFPTNEPKDVLQLKATWLKNTGRWAVLFGRYQIKRSEMLDALVVRCRMCGTAVTTISGLILMEKRTQASVNGTAHAVLDSLAGHDCKVPDESA